MSHDNTDPETGGHAPLLVAVGEGLLEVGVRGDLPPEYLGRGFGGDIANVAVMAARMGARARLLTRLGADAPGRLLMDFWRASGVDVGRVAVDPSAPHRRVRQRGAARRARLRLLPVRLGGDAA